MSSQMRAIGFWLGCAFELALLVLAAILGWLIHHPPWTTLRWSFRDTLLGAGAALPLWLLFFWMMNSNQVLVPTRRFLWDTVRPWLARWSLTQLAVISLLAGVCEEALFRGVIQGKLAILIGLPLGMLVSSLLFGGAHWIHFQYFLLATLSGIYFGGLMWLTDNLLTPVVTHALYDFLALAYLVGSGKRPSESGLTLD